MIGNIFEGEMLIGTLPTTFLQIPSKIIFNSKISVKSVFDQTTNFGGTLKY